MQKSDCNFPVQILEIVSGFNSFLIAGRESTSVRNNIWDDAINQRKGELRLLAGTCGTYSHVPGPFSASTSVELSNMFAAIRALGLAERVVYIARVST